MEYGNIPQNRERIYIVGFKDKEKYKNFDFPMPIKLTSTLEDIIDFDSKLEEKFYYTQGKYKGDIYDQLVAAMDDDRAIYQWRRKYVRKIKTVLFLPLLPIKAKADTMFALLKQNTAFEK